MLTCAALSIVVLLAALLLTERQVKHADEGTHRPLPEVIAYSGYTAAGAVVFAALLAVSTPLAGLGAGAVAVMAAVFAFEIPH